MDEDEGPATDDVVLRWLPGEFATRLAPVDLPWRGRIVLWLWATGYPLAMAWTLGVTDDAETVAGYQALLSDLEDAELENFLTQTALERAQEPSLTFLTVAADEGPLDRERGAGARTHPRHVSWSTVKRAKGDVD
jgi:hypothetical protein